MSMLIRISTPQHGAVGKDKKNSTKSSEIRRSTYSRTKTALLLLTILLFMPTIMAAPLVILRRTSSTARSAAWKSASALGGLPVLLPGQRVGRPCASNCPSATSTVPWAPR